jgi:hypothetical protein
MKVLSFRISIMVPLVLSLFGLADAGRLVWAMKNANDSESTLMNNSMLADGESLSEAARKGDIGAINDLLQNGVSVDAADSKGRTALIDAAAAGQTEAVKVLLQRGAKPNTQDEEGFTALRAASVEGHLETVRALLDGGADVNFKHKEGLTSLMVAAAKNRTDVVRLLASRGADLNARSEFPGFDALCYASQDREAGLTRWSRWKQGMPKHPETIQALLDLGASPGTCFIHPSYLRMAPNSFAILPIQDLRSPEQKKKAPDLPQKLAEALAKEFKPRKYTILTAIEVQRKLGEGNSLDPEQSLETSAACSALGTEGIFSLQLLGAGSKSYAIMDTSEIAISATLTCCDSRQIIWRDFNVYGEHRGFIIARFVSGARMMAASMVTQLPPRPNEKDRERQ